MNLLVTTMGTSWAVVPELFGFVNPSQFPFYQHHPDAVRFAQWRHAYGMQPVDAIWVITTNGRRVLQQRQFLTEWGRRTGIDIKMFAHDGLRELTSVEECQLMSDLVFRVVCHAHAYAGEGGHVYLSLAGGRKTMSADMQESGHIFGCDAMLHVVDTAEALPPLLKNPTPDDLQAELPEDVVQSVTPLVIHGKTRPSALSVLEGGLTPARYPMGEDYLEPSLFAEIRRRQSVAGALLCNYRRELIGHGQTNFRALYALDPEVLARLQNERIAVSEDRREADLAWLRMLPKPELHLHFGGILSPAEMVEVALSENGRIQAFARQSNGYGEWLAQVSRFVQNRDAAAVKSLVGGEWKSLRSKFTDVPEPLGVAGFLSCFHDDIDLLDELVFGKYRRASAFCMVGINDYEALGDLQGSGLMQSEACLCAACAVLIRLSEANHVRYCEVRCSPCNYTRGGLSENRVVEVLMDALKDGRSSCCFRLIFIASRHADLDKVKAHVELAKMMLQDNQQFRDMFVGFDLAGAESAATPESLRSIFLELMEKCIRMTIHAGEDEPVDNIWQAVYHLSADRIGHGLTLRDNPDLLCRFRDRRIAVELCPSSNFQIVGFRDSRCPESGECREYPLKAYLSDGVRVCINTDDPGISRTDLTHEYYKAACMAQGGLSQWEILQLIRNGFRSSFAPFEVRQERLLAAEREIMAVLA